jgi:glycogen operon protein
VLRQRAFFEGRPVLGGDGCKDLAWFHPSGRELAPHDWFDDSLRTIGMYLDGRGLRHRGARGELIIDESFLLVLHAGDADVSFRLPGSPWARSYEMVMDTSRRAGVPDLRRRQFAGGDDMAVEQRSVLLLQVRR